MFKENNKFFKNFMSKLPNENKLGSGQKLYNQAKKSYQMVHCFSQKGRKIFCQTHGQLIIQKQKDVRYGI